MRQLGVLMVQIGAQHHPGISRSGLLQIVTFLGGCGLTGYGLVVTLRARRWAAGMFAAKGRIVDNVPQAASGGTTLWLPMVEFEANGEPWRFPFVAAATVERWRLGRAVNVRYDPRNPRHAGLVESTGGLSWALIVGVTVVGTFLALVT